MERKLQEVHPLLTLCGQIVENWQGNPIQKESLRVFFLVLQVTHYLDAGQVCGLKGWRKGLLTNGLIVACLRMHKHACKCLLQHSCGSIPLYGMAPRVEDAQSAGFVLVALSPFE